MSIVTKANLWMDMLQAAYLNKDAVAAEKIKVAIQAFMLEPVTKLKRQIQAIRKIQAVNGVGTSSDFAQLTKDAFNITIEEDNFDMGWETAFRQVTLGRGQDSWEIYNVENGLSFQKVNEGQRIEMYGLKGTKLSAYVDYYGGALGWTDKMIRYRKVPAMVDMAMIFRNKFFTNKADNHYALLAAAAALNVLAWQGTAADTRSQRDVLTINRAAFNLGNRLKDKGYGDTAKSPLVMYINPLDEERIEAAFRVTTAALVAGQQNGTSINTRQRIQRVYTFNSNIVSGSPIMVLPGQKMQKADDMQPTTFTAPVDPLTLNQYQAVWAIYGAVVADTDQAEQVTLG